MGTSNDDGNVALVTVCYVCGRYDTSHLHYWRTNGQDSQELDDRGVRRFFLAFLSAMVALGCGVEFLSLMMKIPEAPCYYRHFLFGFFLTSRALFVRRCLWLGQPGFPSLSIVVGLDLAMALKGI